VPRLVQWMITERCGLACPHCLSAPPSAQRELDLGEATRLLDELAALAVPQLLLTGGEPLEHPELPRLLGLIAERRLPWSLNTARAPDAATRAALETWPPFFVAVSLDGPEELHDRFRGRAGAFAEALAALRCFAELGAEVAVGTTVTRTNLPVLRETHSLVQGLGVHGWGLHLLVPEGRARRRRDLLPRRSDLRELLAFVAECRRFGGVPVGMADELGYSGPWEPLVRDTAFSCGAGRTACVILADGEVVPCTTTDRSTSAGNVRHEPLARIWSRGFPAVEQSPLHDDCARCADLEICGGGCWLMRRHGLHCARDLWRSRRRLLRVGTGLGLALSACGGPRTAPTTGPPTPATTSAARSSASPSTGAPPRPATAPVPAAPSAAGAPPTSATPAVTVSDDPGAALRRWLSEHATTLCRPTPALTAAVGQVLGDDAVARYLVALEADPCDRTLTERVSEIRAALSTPRSLSVVGTICWRDVIEWGLDRKSPAERTAAERALLATLLGELARWSTTVAVAELEGSIAVLAPVQPSSNDPGCQRYKSGRCPPAVLPHPTLAERRQAAEREVAAHPPGWLLALAVQVPTGAALTALRPTGSTRLLSGAGRCEPGTGSRPRPGDGSSASRRGADAPRSRGAHRRSEPRPEPPVEARAASSPAGAPDRAVARALARGRDRDAERAPANAPLPRLAALAHRSGCGQQRRRRRRISCSATMRFQRRLRRPLTPVGTPRPHPPRFRGVGPGGRGALGC
jgi:radical SAM protein with 4Fe4S-binding SPASM domain